MPETSDPLASPPPGILRDLADRRRVEPDGSVWFADDAGRPILDPTRDGLPNADARGAATWLHRTRPDLWGGTTPAAEISTAKPPVPATISDVMRAVRDGSMSLAAAHAAVPGFLDPTASTAPKNKPSAPQMTVTDAMVRARSGDAAAIAYLNNYTKNYH